MSSQYVPQVCSSWWSTQGTKFIRYNCWILMGNLPYSRCLESTSEPRNTYIYIIYIYTHVHCIYMHIHVFLYIYTNIYIPRDYHKMSGRLVLGTVRLNGIWSFSTRFVDAVVVLIGGGFLFRILQSTISSFLLVWYSKLCRRHHILALVTPWWFVFLLLFSFWATRH